MYTSHVEKRMQQRGFSSADIDLIVNHGVEKISSGSSVYTLTKKIANRLVSEGYELAQVDRCKSSYVVVSDGLLITVAHIK
ncbi:DUF4258 domain-containing protein [Shewanella sp. JM162201]|uniref:DUF4258 domain-containing protein n=1 Tax=Shewanella jiangmenensis TaxID=2837387 RepID=A0ABS5UZQ1_9GAMM|nr:DUF4258 domain-containing protein [Shewanella jiangmenensis]MBT1443655.1 DUF4258 domain-containing protein [Shewanella jiangmenensis]